MEIVISSLIYACVFGASIFFLRQAEKTYYLNRIEYRKTKRKIYFFLAALLPSLLAGFRADTVGVDVNVYVTPLMRLAADSPSFEVFQQRVSIYGMEWSYNAMMFLCSRFTEDAGLVLFLMQFLTIIPIYYAASKLRKRMSIPMLGAVYLFCFYNNSLNIMRQSMACAFILLGTVYVIFNENKNYKKALFFYIIAFLLHKSAILGMLLVFVNVILQAKNVRKFWRYCIYAAIIVIPVAMFSIIDLLQKAGLLSERMAYYASVFVYKDIKTNHFLSPFSIYALTDVALRFMLIFIPAIFMYRIKKDAAFDNLLTMVTCGFLAFTMILFSLNTNYGQRLTMYWDSFLMMILPYSIRRPNRSSKSFVTVVCLIVYWGVWVMFFGWSGSNLYTFRF